MNRVSFGLRDDDEKSALDLKPNICFDPECLKQFYRKHYYQLLQVKEHRRNYYQLPEVKEHRATYMKEYKRMHYIINKERYKQNGEKHRTENKYYYVEWRQNHKDYFKTWKETNNDYFKQYRVQSVVCECGCELQRRNLAKHKTSKKHIEKFL